jgi:hypothetical protein
MAARLPPPEWLLTIPQSKKSFEVTVRRPNIAVVGRVDGLHVAPRGAFTCETGGTGSVLECKPKKGRPVRGYDAGTLMRGVSVLRGLVVTAASVGIQESVLFGEDHFRLPGRPGIVRRNAASQPR